jgi:ATP-binding cassette subfamily G (WHITE) protein 2 (SNQ2)
MEAAHRSSSSLPTAGSVNIERAETSFHELSRQLTQGTVVDDKEQAVGDSHATGSGKTRDVEKGALDAEQPFDLREYLTSSNDANERAGIKHKHVGVLWDDFHVDVVGSSDFKVGGKASQGVTIADSFGETVACANVRRSVPIVSM